MSKDKDMSSTVIHINGKMVMVDEQESLDVAKSNISNAVVYIGFDSMDKESKNIEYIILEKSTSSSEALKDFDFLVFEEIPGVYGTQQAGGPYTVKALIDKKNNIRNHILKTQDYDDIKQELVSQNEILAQLRKAYAELKEKVTRFLHLQKGRISITGEFTQDFCLNNKVKNEYWFITNDILKKEYHNLLTELKNLAKE